MCEHTTALFLWRKLIPRRGSLLPRSLTFMEEAHCCRIGSYFYCNTGGRFLWNCFISMRRLISMWRTLFFTEKAHFYSAGTFLWRKLILMKHLCPEMHITSPEMGLTCFKLNKHIASVPLKSKLPPSRETRLVSKETKSLAIFQVLLFLRSTLCFQNFSLL